MKRHTTLNIDSELLTAAGGVLGTSGVTDTVHAALSASVRRYWQQWMADNPVELTVHDLDQMRHGDEIVIESNSNAPAGSARTIT